MCINKILVIFDVEKHYTFYFMQLGSSQVRMIVAYLKFTSAKLVDFSNVMDYNWFNLNFMVVYIWYVVLLYYIVH
jgi:hypothetical protein